jgi:hypothetical protein
MRAEMLSISLFKKFKETSELSKRNAIEKFLAVNKPYDFVSTKFSMDHDVHRAISQGRYILEKLTNWERFTPNPESGIFGPGSSALSSKTDQYSKYLTPSYSSIEALSFFLRAFNQSGCSDSFIQNRVRSASYTDGVKIITVPKNSDCDRTIAKEPLCNLFLQQSIRFTLEELLRDKLGIDLSYQQQLQRKLALQGSVDGSLATIDLSSASDTVYLSFCEYYLPPQLMEWLVVARSPVGIIDKQRVELHMISTMGNATTFPLQTLIFSTLLLGVLHVLDIEPYPSRHAMSNWGVNGDDIIVPTRAYPLLCAVLDQCGFSINLEKSFNTGFFRESCGGDFYRGSPVRGVYLKTLQHRSDLYVAYNKLKLWSSSYGIPLPESLSFIYNEIDRPHHVPMFESFDSGILCDDVIGPYKCWANQMQPRNIREYDSELVLLLVAAGHCASVTDDMLSVSTRKCNYRTVRRVAPCHSGGVLPVTKRTAILLKGHGTRWEEFTTPQW